MIGRCSSMNDKDVCFVCMMSAKFGDQGRARVRKTTTIDDAYLDHEPLHLLTLASIGFDGHSIMGKQDLSHLREVDGEASS